MRFRPANISLINRRHYLPRLLLILSSKRQMQKPHQRFEDVDRVTPYQFPYCRPSTNNASCSLIQMKRDAPEGSVERKGGLLGFTRVDLSMPPFAFAGLGAGFLSAMGVMAFGYASRPMHAYDLLRYSSMMLFLPTFVVALLQRRCASLPLWFCTVLLIVEGLLRHERGSFGVEVFAVVLLTELARLIRGRRSELNG